MFTYLLAQQLWGLLFNFDWMVHWVECLNVQPQSVIYRWILLCIIIGDVYQFIGHCIIHDIIYCTLFWSDAWRRLEWKKRASPGSISTYTCSYLKFWKVLHHKKYNLLTLKNYLYFSTNYEAFSLLTQS